MRENLEGQVTVITGASSGIGVGIAHKFGEAGSAVVLAARRKERLDAVAEALDKKGIRTLVVQTDVTDYPQVERLVDAAIDKFGQVDVMVNNAGHALSKPLAESTVEDLDAQVDSNLRGVMYGCRAVLPHMIARKTGHIINIGSICSFNHYPNYGAYVAAKFAVVGLTRSVYEEVRPHGIRMNVLAPAAVNTAWADIAGDELPWPREDRLQPEDLAEAAYFCVTLPPRVQVDTMVLWPVCEPTC